MKKALVIFGIITVGSIVLFQSGMLDSLALFLLAGIVPGTTYAIPSTFMLLLMTSIAWLLLLNLVPFDMLRKTTTKKKRPAKQLPRRRYSQL